MTYKIAILEKIDDAGVRVLSDFALIDHLEGISRTDLLECINKYDVIITKSNIQVCKELIRRAVKLKIVGRAGVGIDNFDLDALKQRNIQLITTPTANTASTAEFTICMILNLIRRTPEIMAAVQKNDFRRHLYEGRELSKMSVGILGVGNTGLGVAQRLAPFGCKIHGYDRTMRRRSAFEALGGITHENFDSMLPHINILTLHIPSTPETLHIINKQTLSLMKRGSYILNMARGSVVNEEDLLTMLNNGHVAGAALDLIDPEPSYDLAPDQQNTLINPLLSHPNIIYTPHIAASTIDAQKKISLQLAEKIKKNLHP